MQDAPTLLDSPSAVSCGVASPERAGATHVVTNATRSSRARYPDSTFTRGVCLLFLCAWCGVLFFYGLGAGPLWKTEGLRAIVAADMLRSGNWIVPTLYGEPLFTK